MSHVIKAVYTNGVFRPLEPVVLPEGEPVQVHVPEKLPSSQERLAALDAFDAMSDELTEGQWRVFEDADLLIAATALVHDMTRVTHNMAHFARTSGLQVEDWLMP
jgi:predicted DNA-binding antitoxin AbrB/MazE fold protein